MSKRIEVIARGLWRKNGRVLLCRDVDRGHAYLPGGHVNPMELAEVALVREFIEECGVPVSVGPPLLCWEARFLQAGKPKHELTVVFHVEQQRGGPDPDVIESREEGISFEWADSHALPQVGVVPAPVARWAANKALDDRSLDWLTIDEMD